MEGIDQYRPWWGASLIVLQKMILTILSVDNAPVHDHQLNESYWAVLTCGAVYNAVRGSSSNKTSADGAQVIDHSNESNFGVLSCSVFVVFAITTLDAIFVYVFKM